MGMIDREKVLKGLYAHGYRDCKLCPYWGAGENGSSSCPQLAREALALLKEREPVKPILEQDSMICGNCRHEVIWQKIIGDNILIEDQLNYCPQCGKAVKWE